VSQIEQYGSERCLGVVFDGESAYQAAGRNLQEKYPSMCSLVCQAHAFNLLLKDFVAADPLLEWVITGTHSIIVFINSNKDVKALLQEAQELFYDEIRALPVGVETRFATSVLELHQLVKNMDAVRALTDVGDLQRKYSSSEGHKKVLDLLKNGNFWKAAVEYEELLMPFAETIHQLERDMPLVSQLPRIWHKCSTWLTEWNRRHRILGEFLSDSVFVMPEGVQAASIEKLSGALAGRRSKAWHPCFFLATLLDLRFMVEDNGAFKPDMTLMDEQDIVLEELKRLSGDEADKAELEFYDWLDEGTREPMVKLILDAATKCEGWTMVETVKRVKLVWKLKLAKTYPTLAKIAIRLLSMHATSCSCERLWSLMRWIYRPNRTRLSLEKAEKVAMVTLAEWLKQRILREDFDGTMDSLLESLYGDIVDLVE